ncbi:MAG: transposase [Deltaproteobacteria bacterium]|jgi:hypothetical protein|nr:transposase [Deltaproteobacteria bacterium]
MEVGKALAKNKNNLPVDLMFQDEARFGRMSDPKSCWCPAPYRPIVPTALVREYRYVNGAACPKTGRFDYMTCDDMKTANMSKFLKQVSRSHRNRFVVMVVDGASSHKAKNLSIPKNIELIILPPYSPELNPQEQVWRASSASPKPGCKTASPQV